MSNPFEDPQPASPTPVAAAVDHSARMDKQDAKIDAILSTVNNLAGAVKSMQQPSMNPSNQPPRPTPHRRPPQIEADRRRQRKSQAFQFSSINWHRIGNIVLGLLLVVVVLYVLMNQGNDGGQSTEINAAYKRAIESSCIATESVATDLYELADDLEDGMDKATFLERIKKVTANASLSAIEAPLKSIDEMPEWDSGKVSQRVRSAAHAYKDVGAVIQKLE